MDTSSSVGVDLGLPATAILSTGKRLRQSPVLTAQYLAENYKFVCTESPLYEFPPLLKLFNALTTYCPQFGGFHLWVPKYFPSSQLCSSCGERGDKLHPDVKEWVCRFCKATHDRDINAAINIKTEALRLLAQGYYAQVK